MPADASFGLIIICIISEVHKHHKPTQNITQKDTCQVSILYHFTAVLPTSRSPPRLAHAIQKILSWESGLKWTIQRGKSGGPAKVDGPVVAVRDDSGRSFKPEGMIIDQSSRSYD